MCDWDPLAVRRLLSSMPANQAWPLFDAVTDKPMLALRGSRSLIIDAASLTTMARRRPGLVCRTIDDAGTVRRLDIPQAIEAVRGFLATCP